MPGFNRYRCLAAGDRCNLAANRFLGIPMFLSGFGQSLPRHRILCRSDANKRPVAQADFFFVMNDQETRRPAGSGRVVDHWMPPVYE